MKTLFSRKERRQETISLVVIVVCVVVAATAAVAHHLSGASPTEDYRAIMMLSIGVLLAANQTRSYRAVRHAALHDEPTLDGVAGATAELVAAQRRDFARMLEDIESDFATKLEEARAPGENAKVIQLRVVEDVV